MLPTFFTSHEILEILMCLESSKQRWGLVWAGDFYSKPTCRENGVFSAGHSERTRAEVTSYSKRNSTCMSGENKFTVRVVWCWKRAQRGFGGPWRYSELGWTQPWVTGCELELGQRLQRCLPTWMITWFRIAANSPQDLQRSDSPANWVILCLLTCLKTGCCEMLASSVAQEAPTWSSGIFQ